MTPSPDDAYCSASEEEVFLSQQPSTGSTSWGSRKNYYADDQSASEAEGEDADLILQEALQAQKAQLELFTEADLPVCKVSTSAELQEEKIQELLDDETIALQVQETLSSLCSSLFTQNAIFPVERENNLPSSNGSLLQAKSALQANYALNCAFLLMLKAQGKPIEGHPVIGHLVKLRLLLEKIRPLEAEEVPVKASSSFKAKPEELIDEKEESEAEQPSRMKYRAPKITPAHFEEQSATAKKTKKPHKMSREMLEELRGEIGDLPEEVRDSSGRRAEEDQGDFFSRSRPSGAGEKKRRGERNRLTNDLQELNELSAKASKKGGPSRR